MAPVRTIIVVEDSEDCATTLEIALAVLPRVEIVVVNTAEHAVRTLEARAVSALVTDIHLPGRDGLALVAELRRDPRFARLPIVVISGDADSGTPEQARRAGATAFFAKPYSPAAVRRAMEELMHAG
jgi:CheY-like chemotaxis protein